MNIFIAGGGRVGFHLARLLCAEGRDVTLLDRNPQRREEIDFDLDARTVVGDCTSVLLLQSLNAGDADLFIACTGDDRSNLIAATLAKGLGAGRAVARVDTTDFIESSFLYEGFMNVDYLLSPDALAAHDIVQFVENPGVLGVEEFGRGKIQLCQVLVGGSALAAGRAVRDILPPGSGLLVGTVGRGGNNSIVRGDTVLQAGDKVTLLGMKEAMETHRRLFSESEAAKRVAILGDTVIGRRVAQAFDTRQMEVKLFEKNPMACEDLARQFFHVKVVNRDATVRASLEQEHLQNFDVFVATTEDDERNIMAGVLAREVGVRHVVAVVHQPDFAPLVVKLGIDLALTPRLAFANSVLKIIHQERVTASSFLGEGDMEVVEARVEDGSPVAGREIVEIAARMPARVLIATILRGDQVIVPGGADRLETGDTVVFITPTTDANAARKALTGAK